MKIFLIAYTIVTILMLIYIALLIIKVTSEFMKANPDAKFKKAPFVERAIICLRAGVLIFCPIINAVIFFVLLAEYEDLEDSMYEAIADRVEY